MKSPAKRAAVSDRERVLAEAAINVAGRLDLPFKELAKILGVSPSTVSAMNKQGAGLKEGSAAFQAGATFVRAYRSLAGIVGDDDRYTRAWLNAPNRALNGVPRELMATQAGLYNVVNYLDTSRARI